MAELGSIRTVSQGWQVKPIPDDQKKRQQPKKQPQDQQQQKSPPKEEGNLHIDDYA